MNKKILLLATWYVLWWVVSSLYGKKRPSDLKKELAKAREDWKNDFWVFFDNFVNIHKNLYEDIKKSAIVEENKELLKDKKAQLLEVVDAYKIEWKAIVDELKVKWMDFVEDASLKLEQVYEEKIAQIDELKWVAPEKASELKSKLKENFSKIKSNIEKEIKKINKK